MEKSKKTTLVSESLLEELEKQFKADRKMVGSMTGVIQFNILFKGKLAGTWHMILQGQTAPAALVAGKPRAGKADVIMTIEDRDFSKMARGGLSGKKAYSLKRLRIQGDFMLAQDFEHRFLQVDGPARALAFLQSQPQPVQKSRL